MSGATSSVVHVPKQLCEPSAETLLHSQFRVVRGGSRTFPILVGRLSTPSHGQRAVEAVGESDPTHPGIVDVLQRARTHAQARPVAEPFIERARKRVEKEL